MIELYELQQFNAFAEYGTLSEAAEKLHLSQPALSRTMKKFEETKTDVICKRSQKNYCQTPMPLCKKCSNLIASTARSPSVSALPLLFGSSPLF